MMEEEVDDPMTVEERYQEYYLSGDAARDISEFERFVRETSVEEIEMMIAHDPDMARWYAYHASGASTRALRRFLEEYNEDIMDDIIEMESLPGKRAAGGFVEPYPKRQCVSA